MYSEDDSNSNFARDDEHSQSLSQVRARRAIRLDSQVSLSSFHEHSMRSIHQLPHGESTDANDGGDELHCAPPARGMFGARDINSLPIDVKQRQQMLASSSSRHGSRASNRPRVVPDARGGRAAPERAAHRAVRESASHAATAASSRGGSPSPAPRPARGETGRSCAVSETRVAGSTAGSPALSVAASTASPTPPPRHAFVLSRLRSPTEDAVSAAPEAAEDVVKRESPTLPAPATTSALATHDLRESTLLVGASLVLEDVVTARLQGRTGADVRRPPSLAIQTGDEEAAPPEAPRPPHAQEGGASATCPAVAVAKDYTVGTHLRRAALRPGQVVEEAEDDPTGATTVTPTTGATVPFHIAEGHSPSQAQASEDLSYTPSPLPRPVHTTNTSARGSPAPCERPRSDRRDAHTAGQAAAAVTPRTTPAEDKHDVGPALPDGLVRGAAVMVRVDAAHGVADAPMTNTTPTRTLHEGDLTSVEAPLSGGDSVFLHSALFFAEGGESAAAAAAVALTDARGSMVLVMGTTPTPLRVDTHRDTHTAGQARGGSDERKREDKYPCPATRGAEAGVAAEGLAAVAARAHSPPPRDPTQPTTEADASVRVSTETPPAPGPGTRRHQSRPLDDPRSGTPTPPAAEVAVSVLGTPSARISDEVRGIVARARAEVRRTRESLLSTLDAHRSTFAAHHTPDGAATATRPLAYVEHTPEQRRGAEAGEHTPSPGEGVGPADQPPPPPQQQPLFFHNWTTAQLRSRLCQAAGSIHRRLCGYDRGQHGVLAMETVMKVTFFVLCKTFGRNVAGDATVHALFTEESLARAAGEYATPAAVGRAGLAAGTPALVGRAGESTLLSTPGVYTNPSPSARRYVGLPDSTGRAPGGTPPPSALSCPTEDSHMNVTVSLLSGSSHSAQSGVKRARGGVGSGVHEDKDTDDDDDTRGEDRGRPATRISPTRTLERVLARQSARAVEEGFLSFYLFVLRAFREVFGERYALRHLGATNASRHDMAAPHARGDGAARARTRTRTERSPNFSTTDDGTLVARTATGEKVCGLEDVEGPLESLFPRLRQHYGMRDAHAAGGRVDEGERDPRRMPPLDVLVYYNTFVDSLKEL